MKMLRTSGSFCPWFPNAIESAVVSNVFRLELIFFLTVGGEVAPLNCTYALTWHAWETFGGIDVKSLRVGLGQDRRDIVMDLKGTALGCGQAAGSNGCH